MVVTTWVIHEKRSIYHQSFINTRCDLSMIGPFIWIKLDYDNLWSLDSTLIARLRSFNNQELFLVWDSDHKYPLNPFHLKRYGGLLGTEWMTYHLVLEVRPVLASRMDLNNQIWSLIFSSLTNLDFLDLLVALLVLALPFFPWYPEVREVQEDPKR